MYGHKTLVSQSAGKIDRGKIEVKSTKDDIVLVCTLCPMRHIQLAIIPSRKIIVAKDPGGLISDTV